MPPPPISGNVNNAMEGPKCKMALLNVQSVASESVVIMVIYLIYIVLYLFMKSAESFEEETF